MGVRHVYFTGYTPYPSQENDERMPHIHEKLTRQIHKTALGAEDLVSWSTAENCQKLLGDLKNDGLTLVALEQSPRSIELAQYIPDAKVALLLGREVEGIEPSLLDVCDKIIEIPQFGKKESLNVVQATAIALYHLQTQ
jgi:tRNA G18 (ribose-2'-O)-methylase SpoU